VSSSPKLHANRVVNPGGFEQTEGKAGFYRALRIPSLGKILQRGWERPVPLERPLLGKREAGSTRKEENHT